MERERLKKRRPSETHRVQSTSHRRARHSVLRDKVGRRSALLPEGQRQAKAAGIRGQSQLRHRPGYCTKAQRPPTAFTAFGAGTPLRNEVSYSAQPPVPMIHDPKPQSLC
eukprot:536507-Pleurochrysis_carterae.AAC.2